MPILTECGRRVRCFIEHDCVGKHGVSVRFLITIRGNPIGAFMFTNT